MITSLLFSPTDFTDWHGFVFLVATNALGIGAASFASHAGRGAGIGDWERGREMGAGRASKDIAESPTASPERPPF